MNNLKELRKKSNLTVEELARDLGVHKNYIYMLENGTRTPGFELALKIAKYFREPIENIWSMWFFLSIQPTLCMLYNGKGWGYEQIVDC